MDSFIFGAVLAAAFFHAYWNFLVKSNADKSVAILAVAIGQVPIACIGLLFTGQPPLSSLIYIFASAFLHTGYLVFLMHAYRFGDLSAVYPVARGSSPLLLTLATFFIGQDTLSGFEIAGVFLIAIALLGFGLSQSKLTEHGLKSIMLAMVTGCFIAAYSMVDALGTRDAGSAIAFYGSLASLSALMLVVYFYIWHRASFSTLYISGKRTLFLGGSISYIAYIIVLWACLYAPIASVSSLRETSSLIAVLLGVFLLKEKLNWQKIVAAITILIGVVLIKLA